MCRIVGDCPKRNAICTIKFTFNYNRSIQAFKVKFECQNPIHNNWYTFKLLFM